MRYISLHHWTDSQNCKSMISRLKIPKVSFLKFRQLWFLFFLSVLQHIGGLKCIVSKHGYDHDEDHDDDKQLERVECVMGARARVKNVE